MSSRPFRLSIPSDFDVTRDYAAAQAVRRREEARWRRARSIGILGTVLVHFLLLILFRTIAVAPPTESEAAAGPPAGDLRAGGGGGGLTMIEVRPEQETAAEPTPVPVREPVPEPVEIVVEPEEVEIEVPEPAPGPIAAPSRPGVTAPGMGGDEGSASGPGEGEGAGAGGGGEGEEGPDRVTPPTPRGIFIPPPGRPASARGQEITVWVFVTANGRVDPDQIRLEPPTSDARYNQRLMRSVAEWVFDPARQGGRAVPVWYPFQIIL